VSERDGGGSRWWIFVLVIAAVAVALALRRRAVMHRQRN
jgi:hypothetical protein